jgi:PAS domain S-box-containing protein
MLREATYPPAAVNVLDVSSESMAAFQVFLYGRFWVFTEDLQTIFGISLDTYVPSAEDLILYVYPEDRQRVSRALDDAKQNREPYALEFRIVRPDGTIRWLAARGRFYYSTDDEPERLLGVSLDITERKQAEQAVKESEERFRGSSSRKDVCLRVGRCNRHNHAICGTRRCPRFQ